MSNKLKYSGHVPIALCITVVKDDINSSVKITKWKSSVSAATTYSRHRIEIKRRQHYWSSLFSSVDIVWLGCAPRLNGSRIRKELMYGELDMSRHPESQLAQCFKAVCNRDLEVTTSWKQLAGDRSGRHHTVQGGVIRNQHLEMRKWCPSSKQEDLLLFMNPRPKKKQKNYMFILSFQKVKFISCYTLSWKDSD